MDHSHGPQEDSIPLPLANTIDTQQFTIRNTTKVATPHEH